MIYQIKSYLNRYTNIFYLKLYFMKNNFNQFKIFNIYDLKYFILLLLNDFISINNTVSLIKGENPNYKKQ